MCHYSIAVHSVIYNSRNFYKIGHQKRDNMERRFIIEHVHFEEIVDAVEPPPPNLKPTFNNLHDWLTHLCGAEKPKMPIAHYELGVFESSESQVLYIVGINKYNNPEYQKIDFLPANMYLLLPRVYYEDLTREQLADKLAKELREFTLSSKFKDSYLATSNSIILNGNKLIWIK